MTKPGGLFGAAIVLYFVIALEVLIMISPFAAFFYTAFNPVLLWFAHGSATRWLAAFFLPHMVLPPGVFLKAVRVAGSVLFVGGAAIFMGCAGQVYFHKFFRRGPALGWLYRWIRHPQYLALGATGLGLAILWPRFLTIVLWAVMIALYYFLARDEERRILPKGAGTSRESSALSAFRGAPTVARICSPFRACDRWRVRPAGLHGCAATVVVAGTDHGLDYPTGRFGHARTPDGGRR
jgi:protein-S-isoprenylcysteine O-methyltransferase Ste14